MSIAFVVVSFCATRWTPRSCRMPRMPIPVKNNPYDEVVGSREATT